MSAAVYLIHCLRPLHHGSGEGLGAIDRPLAREVHTGFPYVQSSTIKGTARALAKVRHWDDDDIKVCFGPEKAREPNEGRQGALVLTDAMLLLFPVRSDAATWVWATAPIALARLARWCELAGESPLRQAAETLLSHASVLTSSQHALAGHDDRLLRLSPGGPYGFADDTFTPIRDPAAQGAVDAFAQRLAGRLFPDAASTPGAPGSPNRAGHHAYWREFLSRRLVIVGDGCLFDLVERFTVVEPGISIDDTTRTTETGSLRFTEFLPEESVLFTFVTADESLSRGKGALHWTTSFAGLIGGSWQIGGDETKGKGLVRAVPVMESSHARA